MVHVDINEQRISIVSFLQLRMHEPFARSYTLSVPAGTLPWDFQARPENQ